MLKWTEDYQGWTNWETWNTKLMMDNERELWDESRKIVERFRTRPAQGVTSLENWAIQTIIGPENAQALQSAQEWNDIPEEERIDPHYEELKNKNEQAADIVNQLGFGPNTRDTEPMIIDPNKVNWYEIFESILEDIEEEERYEQGLPPSWQQEQADPDKPGDLTLPDGWSSVR